MDDPRNILNVGSDSLSDLGTVTLCKKSHFSWIWWNVQGWFWFDKMDKMWLLNLLNLIKSGCWFLDMISILTYCLRGKGSQMKYSFMFTLHTSVQSKFSGILAEIFYVRTYVLSCWVELRIHRLVSSLTMASGSHSEKKVLKRKSSLPGMALI